MNELCDGNTMAAQEAFVSWSDLRVITDSSTRSGVFRFPTARSLEPVEAEFVVWPAAILLASTTVLR